MTKELFHDLGYVKGLRRGFTTGTCAQAASKAAALMLVTGKVLDSVTIQLPDGQELALPLVEPRLEKDSASCGIKKESGDDIDVTDGTVIFSRVTLTNTPGVTISGGKGIGRITKPGLPVAIGESAINPTPRKVITRDLESLLQPHRGFEVLVWAPEGEALAKKTWNPRLGIQGGISIIGTTGVVEPKSTAAFEASIDTYIKVAAAQNKRCLHIVSGYVGEKFLTSRFGISKDRIVAVGDHIGHALDTCVEAGLKKITLCGHIGKWSKLAAGLFNTHYSTGDARLETIAALAGASGAPVGIIREILALELAEASIDIIRREDLMVTFDLMAQRIHKRCLARTDHTMEIGVIALSLKGDILGAFPDGLGEEDIWQRFISQE